MSFIGQNQTLQVTNILIKPKLLDNHKQIPD